MAGVVSKQPVKETTFPLQAEEPGTEGKQPDVKTDAYDLADTDLTVCKVCLYVPLPLPVQIQE